MFFKSNICQGPCFKVRSFRVQVFQGRDPYFRSSLQNGPNPNQNNIVIKNNDNNSYNNNSNDKQ